jgi:hypothetical protein
MSNAPHSLNCAGSAHSDGRRLARKTSHDPLELGPAQLFRKNGVFGALTGDTFEMKTIHRRRNSVSPVNFS